jgi:hypothetical protein
VKLTLFFLLTLSAAAPHAAAPQVRSQPSDPVVRLLADLEKALAAPRADALRSLASPGLPADAIATFEDMRSGTGVVTAAVRERDRRPVDDGFVVMADVLVSHDDSGRIATWELTVRPAGSTRDRLEIFGLRALGLVDNLIKLELDRSQQLAVRNLTFSAPDLTLKMASGSAFFAKGESGRTAVVLRGRGDVHFAPPDPAEQGQLRIFSGNPQLDTTIDQVFLRLNPADFQTLLAENSFTPTTVDPSEADRAQDIFDNLASRTYNVNLSDLSPARWSLLPSSGNVAVEFRSARFGWLTYARSTTDPEDITLFDRAHNHNISLYASAEKIAARGRFYDEDAGAAYDILGYGLDVTFDPARSWVGGRCRLRLKITADSTRTLTFRLAEALGVASVSSPELGRLLAMRVVGQTSVFVSLPVPVERGDELNIDVAYSGRLEPQELSREVMTLEPDTALQSPAQDDVHIEIVQKPEPRFMYSNGVYWYPQGQASDYAVATMRLTVPSEYQIVASGSLIGSTVGPAATTTRGRGDVKTTRTAEYFADRPARYLSCVISRFVPVGRVTVEVPAVAPSLTGDTQSPVLESGKSAVYLQVVSTPRLASGSRQLPARAADAVKYFAGLFGEAPYPNLTVTVADSLVPGGHSPAFFALIQQPLETTPYTWKDDPLAFDRFPNFTLAHEIAHQWWGQAVGFKNYHEQWLSEGLAQYSAVLFLGLDRPDIERSLITQMRSSAESLSAKGPIYLGYRLGHIENRSAIYRAIVYNKSAVVLQMLRQLVGDDAFFRGLRRFYHDFRFRKAGTDDFRLALEAESGRPLSRFFERWVMGSALPRLKVTSRIENAGRTATIHVDQIGDVFDLPLTVSIQYADGHTEDVLVPVTEATTERQVALAGPVRKIAPREELVPGTFVD